MTVREVAPIGAARFRIVVPGDKSIAHRALMLAAIAEGRSRLRNVSAGQDVRTTAAVLRALGVALAEGPSHTEVEGVGLAGLQPPSAPLDCGNSGTTIRLLAGLLAGAGIACELTGDRSLRGRPMKRVVEPLRAMGARIRCQRGGLPPLRLQGGSVRGVTYRTPIPSAQIKSCVLLAGLYADGETRVVEAIPSRDHTERMLARMGAEVAVVGDGPVQVRVRPPTRLDPLEGDIPGDISGAAYWAGLAACVPGAEFELPCVGINPTRRGILDRLRAWGAEVSLEGQRTSIGEPLATLTVRGGPGLAGGVIDARAVPGLIDELPLLAALAPLTEHGIEVHGATELRVKESDRIESCCTALRSLGISVQEYPDGFAVRGEQTPRFGVVDARGDHRIAMAFAVLGAARCGAAIRGWQAAAVSYPDFFEQLAGLR